MRSPRTCSTNFRGPVRLGGRSAPSSSASMCFFDWMYATEANSPCVTRLPSVTNGLSKRTVIVYGPSTSMLLIVRNSGAMEFAEPSLAMEAKVNLTSSAVTSVPLWKRTPLRKWNFQVRPPSETCHFSASMGMRLPLPSRDNKFSHKGLSTTSSAPTYRWGSQRSLPKVATATVSVPSGRAACPGAAVGAHRSAATINVSIEMTRRAAIGSRMPCLPMNISLWNLLIARDCEDPYLSRPAHILPVVKAHVAGDQRPLRHLRPHPRDGMGGADGDTGDVLMEPGAHLVPHDAHPLLVVGLGGEAVDELVQLRMLHEEAQGSLGVV